MKRLYFWRTMAVGIASALALWTGTGSAGDEFTTLAEVPTEALSHSEMATIEGKLFSVDILGPQGLLSFGPPPGKKDPLAVFDLNALLQPPKGQQLAAFAFLTPKDLFVFIPGKNNNPLLTYNLGAGAP